jgi:acyl-coenzyme A synthetase/AMP-(fatty) acid ligase
VQPVELLKHCRAHLSPALVPKRVELIDALPRTSTGKLARHLLKRP